MKILLMGITLCLAVTCGVVTKASQQPTDSRGKGTFVQGGDQDVAGGEKQVTGPAPSDGPRGVVKPPKKQKKVKGMADPDAVDDDWDTEE